MKYTIKPTNQFKKDFKSIANNKALINKMAEVIDMLADDIPLPEKNRDHALTGNYSSYRECHISPDWLLIYKKIEETLILSLQRCGTHSKLF